jgi:hypothetical protein
MNAMKIETLTKGRWARSPFGSPVPAVVNHQLGVANYRLAGPVVATQATTPTSNPVGDVTKSARVCVMPLPRWQWAEHAGREMGARDGRREERGRGWWWVKRMRWQLSQQLCHWMPHHAVDLPMRGEVQRDRLSCECGPAQFVSHNLSRFRFIN